MEEWRSISEWPSYEVSSLGSVRFIGGWRAFGNQRRYAPPMIRSLALKKNGYLQVTLNDCGRSKNFYVHRLVAQAFVPNEMGVDFVNHKDGNKQNNCVDNLEWVTQSQNFRHAIDVLGKMVGEGHSQARLTEVDVKNICRSKASARVLAAMHAVSVGTIGAIRRRETWTHITEAA